MSSPSHDQPTERSSSPSRYHNRYAERFKSLSQSPQREPIKTPERSITTYLNNTRNSPLLEQQQASSSSYISPLKNSPLQPNRVGEHKIFEDEVVEQVQINTSPIPKSRTPPQQSNKSEQHRSVPHYMQATEAFEQRVHTKRRREHDNDNLLRLRSKSGITKRVGTSKIPNYRSTTNINAIDDIQSEMTPDDVYIPMAARIKMFEKGLGNASNKPAPITPQYSTSTSTVYSYNRQHHSPTPSSSSRASPATYDSSVPRYARPTSATESRKIITPTTARSTTVKKSRVTESKEVKPFYFATSERAQHYEESFKEKLNLWKGKDKIASIESYNNNKSLKRKRDGPNPPPNKTARH